MNDWRTERVHLVECSTTMALVVEVQQLKAKLMLSRASPASSVRVAALLTCTVWPYSNVLAWLVLLPEVEARQIDESKTVLARVGQAQWAAHMDHTPSDDENAGEEAEEGEEENETARSMSNMSALQCEAAPPSTPTMVPAQLAAAQDMMVKLLPSVFSKRPSAKAAADEATWAEVPSTTTVPSPKLAAYAPIGRQSAAHTHRNTHRNTHRTRAYGQCI